MHEEAMKLRKVRGDSKEQDTTFHEYEMQYGSYPSSQEH